MFPALVLPVLLAAVPPVNIQLSPGPLESLQYDQRVLCVALPPTPRVPSGDYRVQCDDALRRCLVAPQRVLVDGVEGEEPLSRVRRDCWSNERLLLEPVKQGYVFVEARAEAPPGWYRDERGRVMQVNFDLGRRVYFGGAWSPFYRASSGQALGRARPEVGVSITWMSDERRQQHRLHLLEGSALVGQPSDVRFEATVLRYDTSVRRSRPPLWLTTFIGKPRRFDLDLDVSWALEAGRFESLGGKNFLSITELDVVVDLWHSKDLDSFVRVRGGPALEYDLDVKGLYLRPAVAVEADLTLDRDGFHHLTGRVAGEKLLWEPAVAGRPASPQRFKAQVGYEVIVAAINDYPLTLATDLRAIWRDDVPALRGWEFQGNAGLRFSLWAPARHFANQVP